MVGWYRLLNGHGSVQTPGDHEGQGSLACCGPWSCKELDMTARHNNNSKIRVQLSAVQSLSRV